MAFRGPEPKIDALTVGGSLLTLGGAFTTSGAYASTFTMSGTTTVTFPTSGTLATTSNKLSDFAATTSAELITVISDESGTGALIFGTAPTLKNPVIADTSDSTKDIDFTLSGATTGKTLTLISSQTDDRSLTFPDVTGLLAERSAPIEANRYNSLGDAAYTVLDADGYDTILVGHSATLTAARAVTLPTASDNAGREIVIKKDDSSTFLVTVEPEGSENIDGYTTSVKLPIQGDFVRVQSDGSNWSIVARNDTSKLVAFTGTIGAVTSAPSLGTHAFKCYYRRVGSQMEMHYVFNQSTGGSAGSGAYLMTFPVLSSTITADTTFVNTPSDTTSRSGHVGMGFVTNATDYLVCTVQMYGSNKVYVSGTYDSGIGVWGSSFFPVTNATTDLGFIAHVPISEWKDS